MSIEDRIAKARVAASFKRVTAKPMFAGEPGRLALEGLSADAVPLANGVAQLQGDVITIDTSAVAGMDNDLLDRIVGHELNHAMIGRRRDIFNAATDRFVESNLPGLPVGKTAKKR